MSQALFIVAGESSGDLHGATLARALHRRRPDIYLAGIGGHRMAEAGVEIIRDLTPHAAVGISEAIHSVRAVLAAFRRMVRLLQERRPDAVVLIDYPEFNLRFARKAHRLGIPVVYYISPQVWAWRERRVKTIARCVDLLLVILPFEAPFYEARGVEATFVGHPLLDILADYRRDRSLAPQLGLPTEGFILGLLPGSRRREVAALLPEMLRAAEVLRRELGQLAVAAAPAPGMDCSGWQAGSPVELHLLPGRAHELMCVADLLLVASGTATLEAGIIGTPMIVTYRVSRLTELVAKLLVRNIRFCSLVNLVAEREVVPELLQADATGERIAERALELIRSGGLERMERELAEEVRPRLGEPGAASRAADHILELLDRRLATASRSRPA